MDLNELDKILQIVSARDVSELEIEEEGLKLRVRRTPGTVPNVAAAAPAIPLAPAPAPVPVAPPVAAVVPPPPAASVPEEGLVVVKSPIVGTFYRAADPNSPAFANVGDRVKVGQVLCIIEAMKLMNEIESETAGEIVKVHPENGRPVQYGEPLFTIRPER